MPDLAQYQGQWITLTEHGEEKEKLVGKSPAELNNVATAEGSAALRSLAWVSPYPPHIPMPRWPLADIATILPHQGTWLAGGPVRDLLLGKLPHDWDFVTAYSGLVAARSVADALHGAYYPLDKERKTGRAVVNQPDSDLPITIDFAELRASTLEEDLWARDFTINAMALTLGGRLIDPTGGQDDLRDHCLRMTNSRTFEDDPSRLLRAVRLSAHLALSLEPRTRAQVKAGAAMIRSVAAERIRTELVRLMAHHTAPHGLRCLADLGLLAHVLPELAHLQQVGPHGSASPPSAFTQTVTEIAILHQMDRLLVEAPALACASHPGLPKWVWEAFCRALKCMSDPLLDYLDTAVSAEVTRGNLIKWGALFSATVVHPAPVATDADLVARRCEALRFSRKAVGFVRLMAAQSHRFDELLAASLIGPPFTQPSLRRRQIYRFYDATGDAGVGLVMLGAARYLAGRAGHLPPARWQAVLKLADELLSSYFHEYDDVVAPQTYLTGRDLLRMGIPAGPEVGRVLDNLREAQAAGDVTSRVEACRHVARSRQSPSQ